jgi:Bacterial Ig domain/Gametolysin peptidase M11
MTKNKATPKGVAGGWACAALLMLGSVPALASHVGEELMLDQQALDSSNQLLSVLKQYERTPTNQRDALATQLVQLAAQRKERMVALIDSNPRTAALRVLPQSVRARLPAEAQSLVEQAVQLNGSVVAFVGDDFQRGRSQTRLQMADANGDRFELRVAGSSARDQFALSGKRGSVTALRFDRHLLVVDKRNMQLLAADGTGGSGVTASSVTGTVQGVQNTLVIMGSFSDTPIQCTAADVQQRLFGTGSATLSDGYRQSSGGLVSFTGRVIGPFPIAYSSAGACDYTGWASALKSAALAAGVDPSTYQRVSYATPANATCGWTGLASLGGTPPTPSWSQACDATGVFSHELGHNLMLTHASTPTSEYGDFSDPMGAALLVQSNAANRAMAGWLTGTQILEVATGGTYALGALEAVDSTLPRVLRMAKADTSEYYYLSVRQATGIDSGLPTIYKNAVSVHRATGTMPARTFLLATLGAGQSFVDSTNGIQVVNQGVAGTTATVAVSFGGASCTRQPPSVTAGPASQSATPGTVLSYALRVVNNNSAACPAATFGITQALPTGFSGAVSASNVTLQSGTAADIAWSVGSALASPDATYTLSATVGEATVSSSATDHAAYVVVSPTPTPTPSPTPAPPPPSDTTPPALSITNPAAGALLPSNRLTISANASDSSGVSAVEFWVDGVMLARDTSAPYSAVWNTRKLAAGNHSIRVRAIDAVGNVSEQTVSVSKP